MKILAPTIKLMFTITLEKMGLCFPCRWMLYYPGRTWNRRLSGKILWDGKNCDYDRRIFTKYKWCITGEQRGYWKIRGMLAHFLLEWFLAWIQKSNWMNSRYFHHTGGLLSTSTCLLNSHGALKTGTKKLQMFQISFVNMLIVNFGCCSPTTYGGNQLEEDCLGRKLQARENHTSRKSGLPDPDVLSFRLSPCSPLPDNFNIPSWISLLTHMMENYTYLN